MFSRETTNALRSFGGTVASHLRCFLFGDALHCAAVTFVIQLAAYVRHSGIRLRRRAPLVIHFGAVAKVSNRNFPASGGFCRVFVFVFFARSETSGCNQCYGNHHFFHYIVCQLYPIDSSVFSVKNVKFSLFPTLFALDFRDCLQVPSVCSWLGAQRKAGTHVSSGLSVVRQAAGCLLLHGHFHLSIYTCVHTKSAGLRCFIYKRRPCNAHQVK